MLHRVFLCALLAPALLLTGCTWTRDLLKGEKVDYKTEGQAARNDGSGLEIPPDLTKPDRNGRFEVPGDGSRKREVTASEQAANKQQTVAAGPGDVLPKVQNVRLERGGSQRWLVIKGGKPDDYWQTIKEFWQEMGFVISTERPEAGVMETDWAENRSQIRKDFLGRTLGGILDGVYSTPERDKFRTRLEVNSNGEIEVYISHRGMMEIYKNEARETTAWQPRAPDPELEAEMLGRLMARIGSDDKKAPSAIVAGSSKTPVPENATLIKEGQYSVVQVNDGFDRAWRRVGLALDRVGFTVEDRDRSKGLFFVRYADPDVADKKKPDGWLSKVTNIFNTDKSVPAEQYQIRVSSADPATRVAVLNKAGTPEESQTSRRILSLLQEQLK